MKEAKVQAALRTIAGISGAVRWNGLDVTDMARRALHSDTRQQHAALLHISQSIQPGSVDIDGVDLGQVACDGLGD